MKTINYKNGDATNPIGKENKIIVHVCNDIGGWGKGFVLAISKKWKAPESEYRAWYQSKTDFELGNVQFVQVEDNLWIANLIGQHKIKRNQSGEAPIRYEAIIAGIQKVKTQAENLDATIHMPRIGCGLAGGKWEMIEPILLEELSSHDLEVTVYDFN